MDFHVHPFWNVDAEDWGLVFTIGDDEKYNVYFLSPANTARLGQKLIVATKKMMDLMCDEREPDNE